MIFIQNIGSFTSFLERLSINLLSRVQLVATMATEMPSPFCNSQEHLIWPKTCALRTTQCARTQRKKILAIYLSGKCKLLWPQRCLAHFRQYFTLSTSCCSNFVHLLFYFVFKFFLGNYMCPEGLANFSN